MQGLLAETLEDIELAKHTTSDVAWVGSADGNYAMPWEDFAALAGGVEYDPGYGGTEIPGDLVVVFDDGSWLSRGEYDGSEWWDFNRAPVKAAGLPFTFDKKETDMKFGGWIRRDFSFAPVS